jgi:hypothetical protein
MYFIHHFIHLYFFTEFEILFYIYYILPYEKQLVYNMFSKDKLFNSFNYDDVAVDNFINNMKSYNYDEQCSLERDRIDANHDKLWTYCFMYIIFINVFLFLLFVKDFATCYRDYVPFSRTISFKNGNEINDNGINDIKNSSGNALASLGSPSFRSKAEYKKTDFEFEIIDLELNRTNNNNNNNNNNNITKSNSNTHLILNNNWSFCLYYWNKSEFLSATYRTIQFIILIGIFEYLFFSIIVNKYKVVSAKLLLCKLLQS